MHIISSSLAASMTSFAWRLISGDISLLSRKSDALDERHIIQLKGLFSHFDDDRDGYITTEQLTAALLSLGLSTREVFIKKFCVNTAQMKIHGLHGLSFKTDLKTFVAVISREVRYLQTLEEELDALLAFVDEKQTGYITRRELRYLLVDLASPTRLSMQEFTRFVKGLHYTAEDRVSILELKREILFLF